MFSQSERLLASTPAGHEWFPVVLLLALLVVVVLRERFR